MSRRATTNASGPGPDGYNPHVGRDDPDEPLRPVDLRTEWAVAPLGVDEKAPLLDWRVVGEGRGRRQTAFELAVRTGERTVWETGTIEAVLPGGVAYGGTPLRARTEYLWRVRVRDENGLWSAWSDEAAFETGLHGEPGWVADWACEPRRMTDGALDLETRSPGWRLPTVWAPQGQTCRSLLLRTTVGRVAPRGDDPVRARAVVVGAERLQCWVDGVEIEADGRRVVDLPAGVGAHVVEIWARASPGESAALCGRIELAGAELRQIDLDDAWRCTPADSTGTQLQPVDWALAVATGHHGDPPRGREPLAHRPAAYFRREIVLDGSVRRARAYVTALGVYELRINGTRVGHDRLAPGWTDYATRVPYQTYDVTSLLHRGVNALTAVVADGWWAGNICWFGPGQYGERRAFRMQLEVQHDDGSEVVVTTGEGWRVGAGGLRHADLQDGEVFDARLEPPGWLLPEFDDTGWAPATAARDAGCGAAEAQVAPPVKVTGELLPVSIRATEPGAYVVDFGQNLVGWVRLRLSGPPGTRVMLQHAEVLDAEGRIYLENLRSAAAVDEYVLSGLAEGEELEPRFTTHGFRYCRLTGYDGPLAPEDVVAMVVHADMQPTGRFECSDAALNRLQSNILWSQRGNFLSVPTDCPQRDERMGWTGDIQAFAPTATFGYDVRGFLRKWLQDLRDAQTEDGAVTHVAPDVLTPGLRRLGRTDSAKAGAAGWGDAVVLVPAALWYAYGERRMVTENLPAMRRWLSWCEKHSEGLIRPAEGFGDWLAVVDTPKDLVATAFFAGSARVASALAGAVGEQAVAEELHDLAVRVRAAFRARWVRGGARVVGDASRSVGGSQTGYVLALHFGLLDDDERPQASEHLVRDVRMRRDHLATGFLGTPYLLGALSAAGHDDVAFRLLMQTSFPSWLYPVVHGGATTMWERWDSWSDSRGFGDPGMTSFNHYAYGAVGAWMYERLGGLAAGAPGYAHLVVAPATEAAARVGVSWATTSFDSVLGPVRVTWRRDDEAGLVVDVEVPPCATAEVHLPAAVETASESGSPVRHAPGLRVLRTGAEGCVLHVGSGRYSFTVPRSDVTPAPATPAPASPAGVIPAT